MSICPTDSIHFCYILVAEIERMPRNDPSDFDLDFQTGRSPFDESVMGKNVQLVPVMKMNALRCL